MADENWRGVRLTDSLGTVLLFVVTLTLLSALMRSQERYHQVVEKWMAQQ